MKTPRQRIHFAEHLRHLETHRLSLLNLSTGFVACAAAAGLITGLLRRVPGTESLPLLFLVIVAVVAHRFGTPSAILGLIAGGFIFATFLFPPLGSLSVADEPSRTNLVMMVLFGMAVAYFYGAAKSDDDPGDPNI